MDDWLFWRLRWVFLRAAGMALVMKGPCQASRKNPRGFGPAPCLAPGGVKLDLLIHVGLYCTFARAMLKRMIGRKTRAQYMI